MFGVLISKNQLTNLVEKEKSLGISPWHKERCKTVHYPLFPRRIFMPTAGGKLDPVHDFKRDGDVFTFPEDKYVVVEIEELIKVPNGIVGQFVPASSLIELGIGITAGRIEFPYGQENEPIRFGLKNNLSSNTVIKGSEQIAYVQFFDLRSLVGESTELSERDALLFAARIASSKLFRE